MIRRLWLKNYGPYEDASVAFEDFTVILGRNGAGKSLLFSALRSIGRVAMYPLRYEKQLPGELGGYPTRTGQVSLGDMLYCGDTGRTLVLGVEFESHETAGSYEVHLKHWQNPGGIIVEEHLNLKTEDGDLDVVAHENGWVDSPLSVPIGWLRTPRFMSIPLRIVKSRDPKESAIGLKVQRALWDGIGVFRFDPTALKTPSDVGRSTLSPNGYNFATYLDKIKNEPGGTAEFEALLKRFKSVCPHVEDITLPDVEGTPRKRVALTMSASPKKTIPADLESDGTILLLAYASLLHGSRPHDTICIEEPENGVHPKVIKDQVRMLRELTKERGDRPGAQVLVCTHSKRFFDEVRHDPSALRLVRRGRDGRSRVETVPTEVLPVVADWAGLE